MDWKKLGKMLLFPHITIVLILTPVSAVALIYAMLFLEEGDLLRIAAYVLSFYALTILCARIPYIIRLCKRFKKQNKYINIWSNDTHLRMKITLAGTVIWNGGYATLQLGLGIYHHSAWFYSLAGYYCSMAIMRLFLAQHTFHFEPGENMKKELNRYRTCGWIFLLMNLALSGMMLYMIRGDRVVQHNEITTITMATYTFTSFAIAITNVIKYRKFNSPVYSASKAISLASACVSVMTLENTMLSTFHDESMTIQTQKLFMALTGGAIALFIVLMAVYMIAKANRGMKSLEDNNER